MKEQVAMDDAGAGSRGIWGKMMSILFVVARIVVVAYVGLFVLVLFTQSRYVYYPDRVVALTPSDVGLAFEPVELRTADDGTVAAWFVPHADGEAPVVLFCHGNAGNIGDRVESVRTFHELGFSVLIFDYRGYGESGGKPSEQATYQDALAAWEHLTQARRVPPERIVVFGRSLGGAVAAWLAERVHPGALVLESTFASAPDMARRLFPYLPIRLACRFRYETRGHVAHVRCPVLVAHSTDDETIPFAQGEAVFAAAPEPKRFVTMAGGHNSGGLDADLVYQRVLGDFLAAHVAGYSAPGRRDIRRDR